MPSEKNIIILLLTTYCLVNCCSEQSKNNSKPQIKLAVAYDLSGSTKTYKTPALTTDQVDSLIKLIESSGGELAFAPIHNFSYQALIRLKLKQVTGRLDERAERNQYNQQKLSLFRQKVYKIVSQPRQAQKTDLYGAVTRIMLFFEEPVSGIQTKKFLLLVSDGIDDFSKPRHKSPILMPLNLTVVTVGVKPTIAQQLFGGQVILFEAITPAITYIRKSSTKLKDF